MADAKLQELAEELFDVNAVKFGDFATKSGVRTPVYFDLRVIVSYPALMQKISDILYEFAVKESKCDHLCGVPYTALPIATLLAVKADRPMLMRRKEAKAYGTKKMIEGHYTQGQTCLIVEDVVTSGSSVLETVGDLRKEGLVATEAVVILNREQGAAAILKENGVSMRALFTLTELVDILVHAGKIDNDMQRTVVEYVRNTQVQVKQNSEPEELDRTRLSYEARSELAKNPVAKQLFKIMSVKQTNLCVSVDLTSSTEILNLLEKIGPHICLAKTHIDILEDFTTDFISQLKQLAKKHNFLILEDRKYADIGNTVSLQYSKGLFRVAEWADLVTAHSLPGEGVLKGLAHAVNGQGPRGVFLLAEMSSEKNLITPEYTSATVALACSNPEIVAGLVCQKGDTFSEPGLIQLTPGVQLDSVGDGLGQSYRSPSAVMSGGADVAVVGRGVLAAENPHAEVLRYKQALWDGYSRRLQTQGNFAGLKRRSTVSWNYTPSGSR